MTTTEPDTRPQVASTLLANLILRDDAKPIRVDTTGGGPEQVSISFDGPDYHNLMNVYLSVAKAAELRDNLTAALATEEGAGMSIDEARASIGLLVVYRRKGQKPDQGVITSVNDRYVFVRYGSQTGSAATNPADLERVPS